MPKTYKHINSHERDLISVLKSKGFSLRKIAQELGRSPSTLLRELKRNAPPIRKGYYLAHRAQLRADQRNRLKHRRVRLKNRSIRRWVENRLRAGWSPELIAGRLALRYPKQFISHEAIYQWVYNDARHLVQFLARSHRRRYPRGHSHHHKKSHVPERISIQERPKHILNRRQIGHWEADTMISRQSPPALQVAVERKTRLAKVTQLGRKDSHAMSVALTRRLGHYAQEIKRTITYDNGPENHEHMRTNRVLGTRSYFCEPFHSWERGTVENTIGLVRRFFPKKTDFAIISKNRVKSVEYWLNNRPRKCLGFKTPAEVFKTAGVALTH